MQIFIQYDSKSKKVHHIQSAIISHCEATTSFCDSCFEIYLDFEKMQNIYCKTKKTYPILQTTIAKMSFLKRLGQNFFQLLRLTGYQFSQLQLTAYIIGIAYQHMPSRVVYNLTPQRSGTGSSNGQILIVRLS